MTDQTPISQQGAAPTKEAKPVGLALLRAPFPEHQISKLPKPTRAQTDAVKADFKAGIRCEVCGLWHHPKVVHLDYVGHAALTDRLLDCDPAWNWEPVASAADGTPLLDANGGMWIKLTVCGVTRLGYGHPDGKRGGDAIKEVIGDALRNAAMRFGAALDLWHKGQLHVAGDNEGLPPDATPQRDDPPRQSRADPAPPGQSPEQREEAISQAIGYLIDASDLNALSEAWRNLPSSIKADPKVIETKDKRKAVLSPPITDDEIPY